MESETKRERGMMLREGLAWRNHLGVGMLPLSRIEQGSQAEAEHPKMEHPGVPPGEPGARGGEEREQEASGTVAESLLQLIHDEKFDLIVAGAYGHSRLGEWVFGGVTRQLLAQSSVCCVFSH